MSLRAASTVTLLLLAGCSVFERTGPPPSRPVELPAPPALPVPQDSPPVATPPSGPPSPEALAAIADAVPRVEPRSLRGNPAMYEVYGKRYFVMASGEGYRERGIASWYGPDFHAKATSSGEPYDMYAMTAAHKTLPLPTYVRVTNVTNGRSIVVRVNDRGPFVGNRIIDLSYTAAHKLDMTRAGTAVVEVEALTPGSLTDAARGVSAAQQTPALAAAPLYLQAGAFGQAANARQLADRLRRDGFENIAVIDPAAGSPLYRVRLGPIADVASFDRLTARLGQLGIEARLFDN
jgi:rare lipoprotein A